MPTVREQIIQAFTERAAVLSPLGAQRCLRSEIDGDEPFITIWDGAESLSEQTNSGQINEFNIVLEYLLKVSTDENPSVVANEKLGDIVKAMFTGGGRFGNLALSMTYDSATPNYPDDGSNYIALQVTFKILYAMKKGDPFTQG